MTATAITPVSSAKTAALNKLLEWLQQQGVAKESCRRIVMQFSCGTRASVILDPDLAARIKSNKNKAQLHFSFHFSNDFGDGTDMAVVYDPDKYKPIKHYVKAQKQPLT